MVCEHGPFVAGEYEVQECMECGELLVYKIIERIGLTKKLKLVGSLIPKKEVGDNG